MCRLSLTIAILIFIFMFINFNESKPLMPDNMYPDNIDSPIDRTMVCLMNNYKKIYTFSS